MQALNHRNMGQRYVEVFLSNEGEMNQAQVTPAPTGSPWPADANGMGSNVRAIIRLLVAKLRFLRARAFLADSFRMRLAGHHATARAAFQCDNGSDLAILPGLRHPQGAYGGAPRSWAKWAAEW